jgi:hypothetical protein
MSWKKNCIQWLQNFNLFLDCQKVKAFELCEISSSELVVFFPPQFTITDYMFRFCALDSLLTSTQFCLQYNFLTAASTSDSLGYYGVSFFNSQMSWPSEMSTFSCAFESQSFTVSQLCHLEDILPWPLLVLLTVSSILDYNKKIQFLSDHYRKVHNKKNNFRTGIADTSSPLEPYEWNHVFVHSLCIAYIADPVSLYISAPNV